MRKLAASELGTRNAVVRLSNPQLKLIGAEISGAKRRYELTLGA